jgi:hypothetical protein
MNTTKKNRESENSVMVALKELCSLENERVADEAAQAEEAARLEAEGEEARRLEEQRRAEEQARVEAETRARVEAELKRRDQEAEERMAALRLELAAVQADREVIEMEMLARQHFTPTKRRPTFQIAALLVAAVAMVAGGAAFFKAGDGQAAEPEVAAPVVEVVEAGPEAAEPETPETVVAEADPEPEVVEPVKPAKPAKPGKNPKNPKPPKPPKPPVDDWTSNLTCDDPMGCGKGPGLNL